MIAAASSTLIKCYGDSSQVTVSASGGTAPYLGTGVFKVAAGNYSYIVSDSKGLKDTVAISIFQPSKLSANASSGTISSYGGSTSVIVNGSGGTTPYTFSFNNSAFQATGNFSNVYAGTYPFLAKDANACLSSSTLIITQPSQVIVQPLVASFVIGKISCYGGTTTVTVAASGGVLPYTGTGTFSIEAGTYKYVVSDSAGKKDSVSFVLGQPTAIAASVTTGTISSSGGTTSAVVNASGGTTPYLFNMDGGLFQSSNSFTGLYAGTHTYGIKDNAGCLLSQSFSLADYIAPTVTTTTTTNVKFRVSIYPNPSTNYFTLTVKYHGSMRVYLNVYNLQGNLVYSASGNAYTQFQFGSNFIAGTYIAKVNIGGTIQSFKLLKL